MLFDFYLLVASVILGAISIKLSEYFMNLSIRDGMGVIFFVPYMVSAIFAGLVCPVAFIGSLGHIVYTLLN